MPVHSKLVVDSFEMVSWSGAAAELPSLPLSNSSRLRRDGRRSVDMKERTSLSFYLIREPFLRLLGFDSVAYALSFVARLRNYVTAPWLTAVPEGYPVTECVKGSEAIQALIERELSNATGLITPP